jgi:transposase
MLHRNAPLSPEGRRRLIDRCRNRPIAHVAAEMGISRACASKWVNRFRRHGDLGLLDRSSAPHRQPTTTGVDIVARIEDLRRTQKWSAARIAFELNNDGITISRRTVSRHLVRLGLNRRRFIDPNGETNREPRKITALRPLLRGQVEHPLVGRPSSATVAASSARPSASGCSRCQRATCCSNTPLSAAPSRYTCSTRSRVALSRL